MTKPKNKKDEERCPNCGYCPHCGQSKQPENTWWYTPYLPPPAPSYPWYTTTISGGTMMAGQNNSVASGEFELALDQLPLP